MKFYTFDELTYPAVPPEFGPEVRFTNRFCEPRAVTKTYHEHLDEWAICEDFGFDGAYVTRWLENDMKIAGYGHFLGMFHVGNLAHDKVMASKPLFATYVMPALRPLNVEVARQQPAAAMQTAAYQVRIEGESEHLPLYRDFNYVSTRDAPETLGDFVHRENGRVTVGWEMRVPEREPDGFPYQISFVGPTAEQRGSAIRLRLVSKDGGEISDAVASHPGCVQARSLLHWGRGDLCLTN